MCVQMYVFVHVYESLYKLINQYHKLASQTKFVGYTPMYIYILACNTHAYSWIYLKDIHQDAYYNSYIYNFNIINSHSFFFSFFFISILFSFFFKLFKKSCKNIIRQKNENVNCPFLKFFEIFFMFINFRLFGFFTQ